MDNFRRASAAKKAREKRKRDIEGGEECGQKGGKKRKCRGEMGGNKQQRPRLFECWVPRKARRIGAGKRVSVGGAGSGSGGGGGGGGGGGDSSSGRKGGRGRAISSSNGGAGGGSGMAGSARKHTLKAGQEHAVGTNVRMLFDDGVWYPGNV